MSGPLHLTPDAMESLLTELDDDAFAAFVADLYERTGRDTARRGTVVTATTPDGDRERLLVWSDDRGRVGRLLGADVTVPDVDAVDTVVTRERDAAAASMIAEETGADLLDTTALHDRLLYAMDRGTCRSLCQTHFDRAVDPQRKPETDSDAVGIDGLLRPRIALAVVAVCGLLVAGAAGFPGAGQPGGDASVPGSGAGTVDPNGTAVVTPIGGGGTPVPTETVAPTETPVPAGGPVELSPCSGAGDVQELCLPPRPFDPPENQTFTPGETAVVEGTFENAYQTPIEDGLVAAETPPGWRVRVVNATQFDVVGNNYVYVGPLDPGESRNATWEIVPPETADPGQYTLTFVVNWEVPGYDGPGATDGNGFTVEKTVTYRVTEAE